MEGNIGSLGFRLGNFRIESDVAPLRAIEELAIEQETCVTKYRT